MATPLSYLYPHTKKIQSEFSGTLEITWDKGRKLLNTENANYSYGALQRILKFGLERINLDPVNSVLLLGLGGGSVIETLRNDFSYYKKITAVDIDAAVIAIAKTEFNLKEDDQLKIICEDALLFMQKNTHQFDLIIVDLFIDIDVPKVFLTIPFWRDILKASSLNGVILFNASLDKTKSSALNEVIDFLKAHKYKTEIFEKVNTVNTLILSKGL
jgi:spermidine synthase